MTNPRPSTPLLPGVLATFLLVATAPVLAAPTNDDCLACHDDASATRGDGTSIAVDGKSYADSVHGPLECVSCHSELANAEFPHKEKLAKPDCASCHSDVADAYGKGVHARARAAGRTLAAMCSDCHGKHDIRSAADPTSRTFVLNIPKTCGRCHGDPAVIKVAAVKEGDVYNAYRLSVHGQGLLGSGLVVSAECTDCHGSHDIREKADPESSINRTRLPKTCGKCHVGIEAVYAKSIHGQKVAAGDPKAPTCEECHTAHRIRRHDAEAWKLDVLKECGGCHEQSMTTYRDTYHGQVSKLGFTRVATCAACHGSHDILPKADPASRISDARRLQTCQSCHPSATANFAQYDPHADKHDRARNPYLFWTGRFMQLLLLGTFGFFLTHTALWCVRELRGEPKAAPRAKEK